MNALQIIQAAAVDIGIPVPNVAVAATDPQTRQLVGLLNKEGRALSRRYTWQALCHECTFTTVAAESQGTLAAIVGSNPAIRTIRNETFWNRSTRQPVLGPVSAGTWQGYKASVNASPYVEYRIRGNEILLNPVPSAGETCAFEYVTKDWCTNADGDEFYDTLQADTDELLLDSELALLGLKWRWKHAKGLEYGEDLTEYERQVNDAISADGTKPRLNLSGNSIDANMPRAIPRLIGS